MLLKRNTKLLKKNTTFMKKMASVAMLSALSMSMPSLANAQVKLDFQRVQHAVDSRSGRHVLH